jgi:hypothetical protein
MKLTEIVKGIFGKENNDNVIFIEDNRSVADYIEEGIKIYDIEPRLSIKRMAGCSCLPWVLIEKDCYFINESKIFGDARGIGMEIFGKQNAFKFARMRAQRENLGMILFTPDLETGISGLDQKIAISYNNNFDKADETDGSISSMLAMKLYIDDYPDEEIAKLIPLGADKFLKIQANPKSKKLII